MSLEFEWGKGKALSNEKKHRVTFKEAATVFADPLAAILDDDAHSEEEQHRPLRRESSSPGEFYWACGSYSYHQRTPSNQTGA